LELEDFVRRPEVAEILAKLGRDIVVDWGAAAINIVCVQSDKGRLFIQEAITGEPTRAYLSQLLISTCFCWKPVGATGICGHTFWWSAFNPLYNPVTDWSH